MWWVVFLALTAAQHYDDVVAEGAAAMEAGRNEEAEKALRTAIRLAPDEPRPKLLLGRLYLSTERPQMAVDVLEPLALSVPQADRSPTLNAVYGIALAQAGRHESALAPLRAAVKAQPRRSLALFHLGRALQSLERFDEAAEVYSRGLQFRPPENIRFALGLARCRIRLEQIPEAKTLLDELVANHPKVGRAWLLHGVVAFDEGRYEDSVTDTRKARELGYRLPEADLRLGMALGMLRQYDEAQRSLERAIDEEPDLAVAYYYRGLFLFEEGEKLAGKGTNPFGVHAVRLLERSIELAPNAHTSLALAEAYLRLGQHRQVIDPAETAGTVPELRPRALHLMALAHHELLEYEAAEKAYEEAAEAGNDTAELYHDWGNLLSVMGRWDEARVLLEKSLERRPNFAATLLQLGIVYANLKERDKALRLLERVTELAPDMAEAFYQKGVVESRQGDAESAAKSWKRALELDPEQPRLYYRLGTELVKLGRIEERNALLEEFQKREKKTALASQQSEQLENLLNGAVAASESGDDERALALLDEAKRLAPDDPLPYVYLGDFYLSRDRFQDAEAVLKEGLQERPDDLSLYQTLLSVFEKSGNQAGAEQAREKIRALVRKAR